MSLSNKELRFVNEYFLANMNQTEAGRRCGSKQPELYGHRMIKNDRVKAEIERRLEEQKMSAREVLARLSQIGRSDIADFVGVESPSDLLNEEYRGKTHVIKKFKKNVTITRTKDGGEVEHQYTELELLDPLSALDKVGRHHRLFTDVQEITGTVGTYGMTKEEWEKAQQGRRQQAQEVIADFEDESESDE